MALSFVSAKSRLEDMARLGTENISDLCTNKIVGYQAEVVMMICKVV